jgi:hypothetical protein
MRFNNQTTRLRSNVLMTNIFVLVMCAEECSPLRTGRGGPQTDGGKAKADEEASS